MIELGVEDIEEIDFGGLLIVFGEFFLRGFFGGFEEIVILNFDKTGICRVVFAVEVFVGLSVLLSES